MPEFGFAEDKLARPLSAAMKPPIIPDMAAIAIRFALQHPSPARHVSAACCARALTKEARRSVTRIPPLIALMACSSLLSAGTLSPQGEALEQALLHLQASDQRVENVAFALIRANRELCSDTEAHVGFELHDAAQYRPDVRPVAVATFGLGAFPVILAVATNGPAATAGLRSGDALVSVNGETFSPPLLDKRKGNYTAMTANVGKLDAAFRRGPASLDVLRKGERFRVVISPVQGCAAAIQLLPSNSFDSGTDGHLISLTTALVDYTRDDDELAFLIGHELAHNALRHRAYLRNAGVGSGLSSHFGRAAARIKETEVEADRAGLFFAARAGYAPEAALTFWTRFGQGHGWGIFTDPTHPTEGARRAALASVLADIRRLQAEGHDLNPSAEVMENKLN